MDTHSEKQPGKAIDSIQQALTRYACELDYQDLPEETIHCAKMRIIDCLGALVAGFFGESCQIARNLAAQVPDPHGASIIGTRMKTTPDMAAFANAVSARYPELTDTYHWPGVLSGHPSDVVMPVLAAAEYAHASGRQFITAVVLAYEVYLRIADKFRNPGFCNTTFACIAGATAAGKLFGLPAEQIAHCISMAAVPNNTLKQARKDHVSMFKAVAAGQAGRSAIFAALLARAGMEGPHLPFEGKAGWCEHVARERFRLDAFGNKTVRYKILDVQVKNRPSEGSAIPPILAAEKIAPLRDPRSVQRITIEVNKKAKVAVGSGVDIWHPDSREAADHSIPYNVAATLLDGTISLRSFNDSHLHNPDLRELMNKMDVVENEEFTAAFERLPVEHRARITIVTASGDRLVGETGGDEDDLSAPKSDRQIEEKFRRFAEETLGGKRIGTILGRLWQLDQMDNVVEIPRMFLFC